MEAYRIETTLAEDGTVTVALLPFKAGGRVEMIVPRVALALLLERAVAQGEIGTVEIEAMVDLIQATCEPQAYLYQRHQRGHSRERIVANRLRSLAGAERVARETGR